VFSQSQMLTSRVYSHRIALACRGMFDVTATGPATVAMNVKKHANGKPAVMVRVIQRGAKAPAPVKWIVHSL
jgi:hypothetical protein